MLKLMKNEDRPILQFDDWLEMVEFGDEADILSDVLELFESAEKPNILHS